MKQILIIALSCLLGLTTIAKPSTDLSGDWLGKLKHGPVAIRLLLHISQPDPNNLTATLDSIDDNVSGIPVDELSVTGDSVSFDIKKMRVSFAGKLDESGPSFTGTWNQSGRTFPITFEHLDKPFALNRPQLPQAPFPYESEEVTFRNEADQITLTGTLITPEGEGPFPAVLFITGSGPQDRDESLMGHKPFLVIADYLARLGIASLRYDDRGAGKSEGRHITSTITDFAQDADAGISFLAYRPEILRSSIGIIGHSEGGLIGPKLAGTNHAINFLVLLAPPGIALDKLAERQHRDGLLAKGIRSDLIARSMTDLRETLPLIKASTASRKELKQALSALVKTQLTQYSEAELKALEWNPQLANRGISMMTTPWLRSLIEEDPAVYLKTLSIPVLALFGEKDTQVAAEPNASGLETALRKAANRDVEIHTIPGVNHLFQHADKGTMDEYGEIEETFSPEVLQLIGDWITQRYSQQPTE